MLYAHTMETMKVYREIGKVKRTCPYGEHEISVISIKTLTDTGTTYLWDNGYAKSQESVFVDPQGRLYFRQVTIDYSNNISYNCKETGQLFRHVSPYDRRLRESLTYDKV
jgi:hypothetical protein